MKKALLVIAALVHFSSYAQALKLSVYSEISIITVGSGSELFTSFGHTAIRLKDPVLQLDIVYNYGMFDFNQPNFYLNFAKGKLLYKLGGYPYNFFLQQNNLEKRWVKEQVLNLNQQQKQLVFAYLSENLKPQNASYLYDPFFDNCATRPIEILKKQLPNIVLNDDFVAKRTSIRNLMNNELHQNTWGSFGINLALGSKIDKETTLQDYLYLPDYVFLSLQKATIKTDGKKMPLVKKESEVLNFKERETEITLLNPLLIFSLLMLIGLILSYKDIKNKKTSHLFDTFLLALTGCLGCAIVFLSFFTDHSTTPNNLNILWCFPLNILSLFFYKNKKLFTRYLQFLALLIILVPVVWILKIQEFNYGIIPILFILLVRYLVKIKMD